MAKARTHKIEAVATAGDRGSKKTRPAATLNRADVARRAYDLYLARGRQDGYDVEDWLQAERELGGD
jgi:hypothetical protein